MAFKFLIQNDSGKILTEDGEPVLNYDSDTVANAAIDFLAAVFGEDLKQLVSDFNEIHEMIETEREESNKTVREANEFIKRHKKLAEDYNGLLSVSNRQQEQIRELQKENTKLKTDLQKQQKSSGSRSWICHVRSVRQAAYWTWTQKSSPRLRLTVPDI